MLINLSLNNIQTNDPGKALSTITNTIANRAVLTKAMWFIALLDSLAITAAIVYAFMPADSRSSLGFTPSDFKVAAWIGIGFNIFLGSAYAVSEIVINFIHSRGFKE